MKAIAKIVRFLACKLPGFNAEIVRTLESVGRPGEIDLEDEWDTRGIGVDRFAVGEAAFRQCDDIVSGTVISFCWPKLKVFAVPSGTVDATSGLTFIDNRVATQSTLGFRDSRDSAFVTGAWVRVKNQTPTPFDQPIASLGRTDNFYHFMIEALPRVLAISQVEPGVLFITDQLLPSFVIEVADMLDLHIVSMPTGTSPACSHTTYVTTPPILRQPSPAALDILRQAFNSFIEPPARDAIYVSRALSSRSLQGEVELEARLAAGGFRVLRLETMPLGEQIRSMSRAAFVVAPHGAGLTHIAFMHPGSHVLELGSRTHWYPSMRNLSCLMGIDFETLFIEEMDPSGPWGAIEKVIQSWKVG